MTATAIGYGLSGLAMAAMTYELYTNATYARGMNDRVRRVEVSKDALLRAIPATWEAIPHGKVIGTDCWATAPRNALRLRSSKKPTSSSDASSAATSTAVTSSSSSSSSSGLMEDEELLLLFGNAMLQSPACAWEIFLANLKNGKFQWNQPWSEFKEGEQIGAYTVTKRTSNEAMLQWSGNAVDGQTSISIHPDQPAALFQIGATLFKKDAGFGDKANASSQSAANTHMNYLRLVLAQTYTTMEEASKAAHAAAAKQKASSSASNPPGM